MSTELREVWKFELPMQEVVTVEMPVGARVLHTAAQHVTSEYGCLWAVVDPAASFEVRTFRIAGTGHPIPG